MSSQISQGYERSQSGPLELILGLYISCRGNHYPYIEHYLTGLPAPVKIVHQAWYVAENDRSAVSNYPAVPSSANNLRDPIHV